MIRGNHECRQLTTFFNFKLECKTFYLIKGEIKYDIEIYNRVMESFDALPLACVINEKFLSVHGGISPKLNYVL